MITQLVEVPVFSLKEDDIVYNQTHDILQIVMGVNIPSSAFEDKGETMSFYAISAENYEFHKKNFNSKPLEAWEVVPLDATIFKLVTILDKDISALVNTKREIEDTERKQVREKGESPIFEVLHEE